MENKKAELKISGMTCASCAEAVEKTLKKTKGVLSAEVNFTGEKASVVYNPAAAGYRALKNAVESAGYRVIDEQSRAGEEARGMPEARRAMIMAWVFTGAVIIWMLPEMTRMTPRPGRPAFDLGILLAAAPVMFIWGRYTLWSGFKSMLSFTPNMDALTGIGASVSYMTGIASVFLPVANYAGIAAIIMALHLTGRFAEAKAGGRASSAASGLMELGAATARVVEAGMEKEVPAERLKPGDIMVVKPGEKIPADGVVTEGSSAVDESLASGDSTAAAKKPGDEVIGSAINLHGHIKVKALKTEKDSFLAQVIKMVEECRSAGIPIQESADKAARLFVPAVILISAATLLSWLVFPDFFHGIILGAAVFMPWVDPGLSSFSLAILAAVAVLVIACPCALGLAAPSALMAGIGAGAEKGILIRHGAAVQALSDVKEIVFARTALVASADNKSTGKTPAAGEFKEGAREAIGRLETMGIRTAMLTGDNRRTAEAMAEELGITRVLHDVSPGEKVDEIKRLQREFGMIAMVGDGVNDAPALTQADVGIAIGTGTDIASEASDIILVSGSLRGVLRAVELSRATFRKIRQNLFWAYGYNAVAIPVAVFGLLHPVIAAIAMAAGSVSVAANSGLLKKIKF